MSAPDPRSSCLFCRHCAFYGGAPGYSDMTPGSPITFTCAKKHWSADDAYDRVGLRTLLAKASACPDFKLDPTVNLDELEVA